MLGIKEKFKLDFPTFIDGRVIYDVILNSVKLTIQKNIDLLDDNSLYYFQANSDHDDSKKGQFYLSRIKAKELNLVNKDSLEKARNILLTNQNRLVIDDEDEDKGEVLSEDKKEFEDNKGDKDIIFTEKEIKFLRMLLSEQRCHFYSGNEKKLFYTDVRNNK